MKFSKSGNPYGPYDKCQDCGNWKAKHAYRCRNCTPLIREAAAKRRKDPLTPDRGRERARKLFKAPSRCEKCGKQKKIDRHHKDGNPLNNNSENIEFLCRSCHMISDGRAQKFVENRKQYFLQLRQNKTHCKRGHELTTDNTYARPGKPDSRECKRCRADAEARRRSRMEKRYGPNWRSKKRR